MSVIAVLVLAGVCLLVIVVMTAVVIAFIAMND